MQISLLPEEVRIDLTSVDAALWGGITALVKPLDVEGLMRWVDKYPGEDTQRLAAVMLVKAQILGLEGVEMEGEPFDPKNERHFRSVFSTTRKGAAAIKYIYEQVLDRSRLDGEAEKNSDSPSGSDTTSSLAS